VFFKGFRRNRPKWPGTKFATAVQCGCTLDHCIGFHEQRKNVRKVPLQQKGWKTLVYTHRKVVQSSSKDQVGWLHLRPCLVPSWCGASRTIWDCCWSWEISSPPWAAASVTRKRKIGHQIEWMNMYAYIEPFYLWNCLNLFAKSECRIQTIKHIWTETCVFVKMS